VQPDAAHTRFAQRLPPPVADGVLVRRVVRGSGEEPGSAVAEFDMAGQDGEQVLRKWMFRSEPYFGSRISTFPAPARCT
jgi:hypothetical protein